MTGETDDARFPRADRQRWRIPRTGPLVRDLSLVWLQIVAGVAVFAVHPALWTWLIAVLLIGGAQHGFGMIAHEAAHRLLWPHDDRINDRVGSLLFAGPVLLPFSVYRHRHLAHHRLVSRANDTKSLYRRDFRGTRFWREALRSLTGVDYVAQALDAIRHGQDDDSAQFAARLRRDWLDVAAAQGALFLLFLAIDPRPLGVPTYYVLLWIVPLVTVSFWFSKMRSAVEHQPFRTGEPAVDGSPYFLATPVPYLRSVRAGLVERLVLSKINFHFHAEHHMWPWIAYQHLPEVSERLWNGGTGTLVVGERHIHMEDGYLGVLRRFQAGR